MSNFAFSLNIPPQKLFRWSRRSQLWANGHWLLHCDNVLSHVSHLMQVFLVKQKITQVTQQPLQPRFITLRLLVLPKTKITFEKEEMSDDPWDSGKYDRVADGDWQNWVRSQGAYSEGDWGITVLCTVFLLPCIFFNKCLYFSYCMAGYFVDRHIIYIFIFQALSLNSYY